MAKKKSKKTGDEGDEAIANQVPASEQQADNNAAVPSGPQPSAVARPGAVSRRNISEDSALRRKGLRQRSDATQESTQSVEPGATRSSAPVSVLHKKGLRQSSHSSHSNSEANQETINSSQNNGTEENDDTTTTNPNAHKRAIAYALDESEAETEPNPQVNTDTGASQPGAYSGTPGHDPQRRDNVDFSIMGVPSTVNHQQSNRAMPVATTSLLLEEREEEEITVGPEGEDEIILGPDPADDGLVVAHPVASFELPQAEEVDNSTKPRTVEREPISPRRQKQRINIIAAVVLAVIITVVVLVLVLRKSGNGDGGGEEDIATPAEQYIMQFLPNETLPELKIPATAQSQAFDWLARDPSLYDYPDWRLRQRFALASLYYSTTGATWYDNSHWLSYNRHECDWYHRQSFGLLGVDVIGNGRTSAKPCQDGSYQHLWLNTNQLRGSLPFDFFEMVPSLRTISLHANALSGTLSPAIFKLSHLEALSLASNQLTSNKLTGGAIPSQIGLLNNLTYLVLTNNRLDGTIPSSIFENLGANLKLMMIDENHLSGTLATELGRLTGLSKLYLQSNSLTGPLPSEVGLMSLLDELQVQENVFTGSIPKTFETLSNLTTFVAENNRLSGKLPSELGLMASLTDLDLQRNVLTGSIPSSK